MTGTLSGAWTRRRIDVQCSRSSERWLCLRKRRRQPNSKAAESSIIGGGVGGVCKTQVCKSSKPAVRHRRRRNKNGGMHVAGAEIGGRLNKFFKSFCRCHASLVSTSFYRIGLMGIMIQRRWDAPAVRIGNLYKQNCRNLLCPGP
jgi:hypothetical protein